MTLIERIEKNEGFRPKPYQCSEGVWTFGHGLTYITESESRYILKKRVSELRHALKHSLSGLTPNRQNVIIEMAYNLGVRGLFGFKYMWSAIYQRDYERAAQEMLNSKWAVQVGKRAERLAEEMRRG
jgi:lysozyme